MVRQHDPYSGGDPGASICARNDLRAIKPRASGAYDTKVKQISFDILHGHGYGFWSLFNKKYGGLF